MPVVLAWTAIGTSKSVKSTHPGSGGRELLARRLISLCSTAQLQLEELGGLCDPLIYCSLVCSIYLLGHLDHTNSSTQAQALHRSCCPGEMRREPFPFNIAHQP